MAEGRTNTRCGSPPLSLPQVVVDGEVWNLVAIGSIREDGWIYLHLSSTTRFRPQRNGPNPVQICDWFDRAVFDTPLPAKE